MLEIITPFIIVICLLIAYFLFEVINKKTNLFSNWHWTLIASIPFILFVIVGAPMIATKVETITTIFVTGCSLAFAFGFAVSCLTCKYKNKRDQQKEKIKEATIFGYKSNQQQKIKNKNKEGKL